MMPERIDAIHALHIHAHLGEGPIWVDDAVWFVDVILKRIYRYDPAEGSSKSWDVPERVGWVVPAERGDFIIGLESGLHRFNPRSSRCEMLAAIETDMPTNRLNDAAVDGTGRIWFGTMESRAEASTGRLYRWDGVRAVDTGAEPVRVTNGPGIPPVGDMIYHVDSVGKRVIRYRLALDGAIDAGETFLTFGEDLGVPDGATCDAEGGLWLAFYGGWEARRYASDGSLTTRVHFPVSNVTKIALGGADGRTAWATTARQELDAAELSRQPLAGDLFTFRVDVPAAPVSRARGATPGRLGAPEGRNRF